MENTLGHRIRKYRLRKQLTQEKLAELCSVSPPTVSRWENGSLNPSRQHLLRLANVLNTEFVCPSAHVAQDTGYSDLIYDIIEILTKMGKSEQELVLNILINLEKYCDH